MQSLEDHVVGPGSGAREPAAEALVAQTAPLADGEGSVGQYIESVGQYIAPVAAGGESESVDSTHNAVPNRIVVRISTHNSNRRFGARLRDYEVGCYTSQRAFLITAFLVWSTFLIAVAVALMIRADELQDASNMDTGRWFASLGAVILFASTAIVIVAWIATDCFFCGRPQDSDNVA